MSGINDSQRGAADPQYEPGIVARDRECLGCGYNLRGLLASGRCPECGMPIHIPAEIDDPLSRAPMGVIKRFRGASWLATGCVIAVIISVLGRTWLPSSAELRAAQLVLAVLWLAAVWLLTPTFDIPQASFHGFSQRGRLRLAARLLQLGWILAAGGMYIQEAAPRLAGASIWSKLLQAEITLGLVIGMAGIVALGVLLQRLADWTRDSNAERAFNLAVWGIPLSTIFLSIHIPNVLITLVLAVIWAISMCAFPYALLSLSNSLSWSVKHAREYHERLRRQRQRAQEHHEQIAGRIDEMDAAGQNRDRDRSDAGYGIT